MKTTASFFCFWALVPLAFSATISTEQKRIAVAVGNAIVTYDYNLVSRPNVNLNVTKYSISAMTYDPLTDTLIGVTSDLRIDQQLGSFIFRYDPKSKNQTDHILKLPIDTSDIKSIAYDYLGNNLYISIKNKIEVYSLSTLEKTEFLYYENPFDMVLIPEEGKMFVVFQLPIHPYSVRIVSKKMNNNDTTPVDIFVNNSTHGSVISLAYDKDNRRLFWADTDKKSIDYADSDNKLKTFRQNIKEPVDIAILDDKIFWTSRDSSILNWTYRKEIGMFTHSYSNDTRLPPGKLLLQSMDSSSTRQMMSNSRQMHPCSHNNGDCSHVCLVTDAKSKICACPLNFYLDHSDMKTCKSIPVDKNSSCSNGSFWLLLVVGLVAFVATYSQ